MPTKFMEVCNTILHIHESDWTFSPNFDLRNDSHSHSKNMLCESNVYWTVLH